MIDAVKLRSICTALAFSNTGEHLATATEDSVGVHIWTNRTLFTHVPTRHISNKEIAEIDAPTASGEGGEGAIAAAYEEENVEEEDEKISGIAEPSLDQLSDHMMTLSLVPKSRWQNLLHLDLIRQRNKPKEPPKPPEKAPFFLPSLQGNPTGPANSTANGVSTALTTATPADISRISKLSSLASSDNLTASLLTSHSRKEYKPFLTSLSALNPSAADLFIRSLSSTSPYTELIAFVTALTSRLRERRDYELVQAWMAVFLRLHGEVIAEPEAEELRRRLRELGNEVKSEGERLGGLGGYCAGVVGFLRSAR